VETIEQILEVTTRDVKHRLSEVVARRGRHLFKEAGAPGEAVVVEGAKHRFIETNGVLYPPEAGPSAWTETTAFFKRHLTAPVAL